MLYKQGPNKQEIRVLLQHRPHEWQCPTGNVEVMSQQQSIEVTNKETNWSKSSVWSRCCSFNDVAVTCLIPRTGTFVPDVVSDSQWCLVNKRLVVK